MDTLRQSESRAMGVVLTAGIVELTLITAYIHFSLGGLLFLLNAAGYIALAAAILAASVVRHPLVARFSWLPRIGLAGYTGVTIAGYLVMGPYFGLGWVAKAVELVLITLLAADVLRVYGSPAGFGRSIVASLRARGPMRAA
jgi:hypothetical protein